MREAPVIGAGSAFPKPSEATAYLHRHIPLSAAMEVRVTTLGADGAELSAPLAPNINHRATVFGGSASAVAILAAWTWLHFALRAAGRPARLVIQQNSMEYLAPITVDFTARCRALPAAELEKFVRTLARHGKARCSLAAELSCGGAIAGRFRGDYVAARTGE